VPEASRSGRIVPTHSDHFPHAGRRQVRIPLRDVSCRACRAGRRQRNVETRCWVRTLPMTLRTHGLLRLGDFFHGALRVRKDEFRQLKFCSCRETCLCGIVHKLKRKSQEHFRNLQPPSGSSDGRCTGRSSVNPRPLSPAWPGMPQSAPSPRYASASQSLPSVRPAAPRAARIECQTAGARCSWASGPRCPEHFQHL
jgi:hypothetical protein